MMPFKLVAACGAQEASVNGRRWRTRVRLLFEEGEMSGAGLFEEGEMWKLSGSSSSPCLFIYSLRGCFRAHSKRPGQIRFRGHSIA